MRDRRPALLRSRRPGRAALAVSALALSACTVGPNYRRPELPLPDEYGVTAVAAGPTGTVAGDWWTLYDDPLLNELVAGALARNPDLARAMASIEEARASLRITNAAFFPEINANALGARSRTGAAGGSAGASSIAGTGAIRYGNIFTLDAAVSYELDLWGRVRRSSEASRAQLLATTYARDVTALALAATTTQAYFTLRSLDAQIVVSQSTLDAVNDSLGIARKRLDAGYSSGLDYAQAQALAAQTAVQLRDLRRQRAVTLHQLANLTSDLTLQIAPGSLDALPIPLAPPAGLPSTLLERRPDVRQAEQQLVASNAQIGVATAQLFPTFSLTGAYGGQSFDLSDLLKSPFRFWNIGLGIAQPIFAGGKYVAQVDQARARNDQQIAAYQSTVEGAFQEVADALTNVSETGAAEADVQLQVEAARRSLRLSRLQYDTGYAAYLTVLDATRTTNSAELQLVQNRQLRLSYSVDLLRALGGGWNPDQAGASPPGAGAPVRTR